MQKGEINANSRTIRKCISPHCSLRVANTQATSCESHVQDKNDYTNVKGTLHTIISNKLFAKNCMLADKTKAAHMPNPVSAN